jgi:hypothetical protein
VDYLQLIALVAHDKQGKITIKITILKIKSFFNSIDALTNQKYGRERK